MVKSQCQVVIMFQLLLSKFCLRHGLIPFFCFLFPLSHTLQAKIPHKQAPKCIIWSKCSKVPQKLPTPPEAARTFRGGQPGSCRSAGTRNGKEKKVEKKKRKETVQRKGTKRTREKASKPGAAMFDARCMMHDVVELQKQRNRR